MLTDATPRRWVICLRCASQVLAHRRLFVTYNRFGAAHWTRTNTLSILSALPLPLEYCGIWCLRLELNQRRWALQAHALPAELHRHMYRWFPGLEPTTLLDLYIPKTIHKLTPWSRVLELNQFKAGCSRLHDRPDHSAWSLLTVTIRFLESHNLVCYHYTKAGICTRHIFNSSLTGRCVSRE